jgi:hypothetical protein
MEPRGLGEVRDASIIAHERPHREWASLLVARLFSGEPAGCRLVHAREQGQRERQEYRTEQAYSHQPESLGDESAQQG